MPDLKAILDDCFAEFSQEYEIERVTYVSQSGKNTEVDVPVWRLVIQAEYHGKVTDVELFLAFPHGFPYEMSMVFIDDERFRYLPHISPSDRKVCLYEDGLAYNPDNIKGLLRDNIKKTRHWIELYSNRDNTDEYVKEIKNYWREQYDGESEIDDCPVLLGSKPEETCELSGIVYSKRDAEDGSSYVQPILFRSEERLEITYIKKYHKVIEIKALYLASIEIPNCPPYSMTGQNLIDSIASSDDKAVFKQYITQYGKGYVFFPLGMEYAIGGVYIEKLNVNRKGFRSGTLKPFSVLTAFENKTKLLDRLLTNVYDKHRLAERTAGCLMEKRKFVVAGLGSVGSNLCYFLNGYNNAEFALVDGDRLSADNIGRHLLGFEYLNQRKSFAVANYLKSFRPDRNVNAYKKEIQQISDAAINEAGILFMCTGDIMSEKWLIHKMQSKEVDIPSFIMWLEPYGVSGVMIYVNPDDDEAVGRLQLAAEDNFMDLCLIDRKEYETGDRLIQRDAGCNGNYAFYSANDVTLFLSGMFQHIDRLLNVPSETQIYQWVGNIEIAEQKGIKLVERVGGLSKNQLLRLPL